MVTKDKFMGVLRTPQMIMELDKMKDHREIEENHKSDPEHAHRDDEKGGMSEPEIL